LKDRIGEYLVKTGVITDKQLTTALERQLIMGGRLGSNLIELGLISENELVKLLSKKMNIPPAFVEDLEEIDPQVLSLITRENAEKYSAVPFRLERKNLDVAFLEPMNLEAVTELGFITGYTIRPHISVEARILYALERFYQISRPLRFISLLDDERKRHEEAVNLVQKRKDPSPEDLQSALEDAKEEWAVAQNRDDAITTFLKTAHVVFDRGILFLVKSSMLFGWRSFPVAREAEVKKLQFTLSELPEFKVVVDSKIHFQGPPPEGPAYGNLLGSLDGSAPKQILVVPLIIKNSVVSVLYGDNQSSEISAHAVQFIQTAAQKTSLSLEILILKNKILEQ
jgi:hypothetical protein